MRRVRVMTYNIHHWCGPDGCVQAQRAQQVAEEGRPELLAIQECGGVTDPELTALAARLGLIVHAAGESGLAWLSRVPLRGVGAFDLGGGGECLVADFDCDGRRLQLYNVRLESAGRREQIDSLLGPELLGHPRRAHPVLIVGDFADRLWGAGNLALALRLRRGGRLFAGATYPSRAPRYPRDRAYLLGDVVVCGSRVIKSIAARAASPHLPLLFDIQLTDRRRYLPIAEDLAPKRMGTAPG